ncbi:N-acetylmuramoyl-L-alanine amidase [Hirschia litorea]|uniref:N-acetylmuramoyl-L-alanine amidase n=1 Tax=Hirschia litorea TaxID=1199156 RepID=A0ABW2IID3_9PROT
MRQIIFAIGCLFIGILSADAFAQASVTPRITDVRFGDEGEDTRVVIDANIPIDYEYFTLSNGAKRIVLDMPRLRWSINGLTSESGKGNGSGLVQQYRYGHNSPTTSRLVLDLEQAADVKKAFRVAPKDNNDVHRIVLDLETVSEKKFEEQAGAAEAQRRKSTAQQYQRRKPIIVIDAGHGGRDPGTHGHGGKTEKEVNLAAALELSDALKRTGRYEVALTRGTDVFIELEDRVNIARRFEVDLFISLHADAGRNPSTRGASVYTLSASGEKRAKSLKQTNNWVLDIEKEESRSKEVTDILVDLVERETKNRSAEFAEILIPEVQRVGWPTLSRSHRDAGFYVLLAPDVPAVLFEMGFMSNKEDEALLTSSRHRKRLMKAIVNATNTFFADKEFYVAQR